MEIHKWKNVTKICGNVSELETKKIWNSKNWKKEKELKNNIQFFLFVFCFFQQLTAERLMTGIEVSKYQASDG